VLNPEMAKGGEPKLSTPSVILAMATNHAKDRCNPIAPGTRDKYDTTSFIASPASGFGPISDDIVAWLTGQLFPVLLCGQRIRENHRNSRPLTRSSRRHHASVLDRRNSDPGKLTWDTPSIYRACVRAGSGTFIRFQRNKYWREARLSRMSPIGRNECLPKICSATLRGRGLIRFPLTIPRDQDRSRGRVFFPPQRVFR
jgi:hypothetical protein